MPSDREVQAKRRQAIVEILNGDEQVSEQRTLLEKLHAMGIPATQSSVSRDLKVLGAVRTRGYYEIPSWNEEEEEEAVARVVKVVPFIRSVKQAGPYQTLLVTDPGAGHAVSRAIDEANWEDVVGTVGSDSSVLILTENFFFQRLVWERLKYFMSNGGERELVELPSGRPLKPSV